MARILKPEDMPTASMQRVILHWTAGTHKASATDRKHYHFLIEGNGDVVKGNRPVNANATGGPRPQASHTLNTNTGSIGVSLCCMAGAVESPYSAGRYPMTAAQLSRLAEVVADLCIHYAIPVTAKTVLSHAEVEKTLGKKQRGKWDFTVLPPRPELKGAKVCGDYIRSAVAAEMARRRLSGKPVPAPVIEHWTGTDPLPRPTRPVRIGNGSAPGEPAWSKEEMEEIQTRLKTLGYDPGGIDGRFGTLTAGAVTRMHMVNGTTGPVDSIPRSVAEFILSPSVKPMAVSAERAAATPAEISAKVPEAKATRWAFLTNAGEKVISAVVIAAGYFSDTTTKVVESLPEPIRDAVRDVPSGVIWTGVAVIAAGSLLMALRGARAVEGAYTRGRL